MVKAIHRDALPEVDFGILASSIHWEFNVRELLADASNVLKSWAL